MGLYPQLDAPKAVLDSVWLIGALISCSIYGTVMTLAILNTYLLLKRFRSSSTTLTFTPKTPPYPAPQNPSNNAGDRRMTLLMLAFVAFQSVMSTITVISSSEKTRMAFVEFREYEPGGPSGYQNDTYDNPVSLMGIVASVFTYWGSDGLLLWRCFAFYRSATIVPALNFILLIPLIMYIGSIGTGITIITLFATKSPAVRSLVLIFGSMSGGLMTLLTLLIIVRLLYMRRSISKLTGQKTMGKYTSVIAMLVESASIFVIFMFFYLISFGLKSPASVVPVMSMALVQVVASFMIIYRVAQGTTDLNVRDMNGYDDDHGQPWIRQLAGLGSNADRCGTQSAIVFHDPPSTRTLDRDIETHIGLDIVGVDRKSLQDSVELERT